MTTLGDYGDTYQTCFRATIKSWEKLFDFLKKYGSWQNYLIYLFPNILSYSFIINRWVDQLQEFDEAGDTLSLAYYYGLIFKNLFFYDVVEKVTWEDYIEQKEQE